MNSNVVNRTEEVTVELKYCERCGGLWLRRQGMSSVHCGGCRAHLTRLMCTRPKKRLPERKGPTGVLVDCLQGVVGTEVRA